MSKEQTDCLILLPRQTQRAGLMNRQTQCTFGGRTNRTAETLGEGLASTCPRVLSHMEHENRPKALGEEPQGRVLCATWFTPVEWMNIWSRRDQGPERTLREAVLCDSYQVGEVLAVHLS